jgi:hypothetical protein
MLSGKYFSHYPNDVRKLVEQLYKEIEQLQTDAMLVDHPVSISVLHYGIRIRTEKIEEVLELRGNTLKGASCQILQQGEIQ